MRILTCFIARPAKPTSVEVFLPKVTHLHVSIYVIHVQYSSNYLSKKKKNDGHNFDIGAAHCIIERSMLFCQRGERVWSILRGVHIFAWSSVNELPLMIEIWLGFRVSGCL